MALDMFRSKSVKRLSIKKDAIEDKVIDLMYSKKYFCFRF